MRQNKRSRRVVPEVQILPFFPTERVIWVGSGSIRQEEQYGNYWDICSDHMGRYSFLFPDRCLSGFYVAVQLTNLSQWLTTFYNVFFTGQTESPPKCRWFHQTTSSTSFVWWTRTWRVKGTPCSPLPPSRVSAAGSPTLHLRRYENWFYYSVWATVCDAFYSCYQFYQVAARNG